MVPTHDDDDDIELEFSDAADDFKDDVEGGPILREEDEPKRRGRPPKEAKKPAPPPTPKVQKMAAAVAASAAKAEAEKAPKADIEEAEMTKELLEGLVSTVDRVIETLDGVKDPKLQSAAIHLKAAHVALTNGAVWLHDALSKYQTPE